MIIDPIITNNIRIYYLEELYQNNVGNIQEFAVLCDIPEKSMCRYLDGIIPRYEATLRKIESALGKPPMDVHVLRAEIEWDKKNVSWQQPKLRGRRKYVEHRAYANATEEMDFLGVAEETMPYNSSSVNLRQLREAMWEVIPEEYLRKSPKIWKFVHER